MRSGRMRIATSRVVLLESLVNSSCAYRAENYWYNSGYIFPDGYHSRTTFRSSVNIGATCSHDCYIIGAGGKFWPRPTFEVIADDRPHERIVGKSSSSCFKQVCVS
jgi:hypothetical protein